MPLGSFPATFHDALIVCRNVGIRYIWIDALCIIQNSPGDWDREAANMASVYGQAVFTISALHSSSSGGGLFCNRPRLPFAKFSSPLKGTDAPRRMGIRLAYPDFDQEMDDSPLSSRGWIYQERAPSQARLHYSANQMIWECRNMVLFEGSSDIEMFTRGITYDFGRILWRLDDSNFEMRIEEWETVGESFSRLRFTQPTDKLPAISGVASRFRDKEVQSQSIPGLWLQAFHKHLLWMYDGRDHPSMMGPPQNRQVWLQPCWRPRSPSWSWISVDYPVRFFPAAPAEDLEWDIKLPDTAFARAPSAWSATRGNNKALEVTMEGRLVQLKLCDGHTGTLPALMPVSGTFQVQAQGRSVQLNARIDPGRSLPSQIYALKVATYTGMGPMPIPPYSYFLLLEALDITRNQFMRIGIGLVAPDLAMAIFSVPVESVTLQ